MVVPQAPLWRDLVAPLLDISSSKFVTTLDIFGVQRDGGKMAIAKINTVDPVKTYSVEHFTNLAHVEVWLHSRAGNGDVAVAWAASHGQGIGQGCP